MLTLFKDSPQCQNWVKCESLIQFGFKSMQLEIFRVNPTLGNLAYDVLGSRNYQFVCTILATEHSSEVNLGQGLIVIYKKKCATWKSQSSGFSIKCRIFATVNFPIFLLFSGVNLITYRRFCKSYARMNGQEFRECCLFANLFTPKIKYLPNQIV